MWLTGGGVNRLGTGRAKRRRRRKGVGPGTAKSLRFPLQGGGTYRKLILRATWATVKRPSGHALTADAPKHHDQPARRRRSSAGLALG